MIADNIFRFVLLFQKFIFFETDLKFLPFALFKIPYQQAWKNRLRNVSSAIEVWVKEKNTGDLKSFYWTTKVVLI